MMEHGPGFLLLLLLTLGCRTAAVEEPTADPVYAVFPVRDLSGDRAAAEELLAMVVATLGERGAAIIPVAELDEILRQRRVRITDSVSVQTARVVAAGTGADHVLLMTVYEHQQGRDPRVAAGLRVVECAGGERVQSHLVSLGGDDFAGLLGLGRIDDLGELRPEVAARLTDAFDARGRPLPLDFRRPGYRRPPGSAVLTEFSAPGFELEPGELMAVLPFVNHGQTTNAGVIFSDALADALGRRAGVRVVEAAEVRAALVAEKVRSLERLDVDTLTRLGRSLGIRHIVSGSVDKLRDDRLLNTGPVAELEVGLRILDVETGRLVWSGWLRRSGEDYRFVLGLEIVRDTVVLASRTSDEVVETLLN